MIAVTLFSLALVIIVTLILAWRYRDPPKSSDPRVDYFPTLFRRVEKSLDHKSNYLWTVTTRRDRALIEDVRDFHSFHGLKKCFVIHAFELKEGDVIKWGGVWRKIEKLTLEPRPEDEDEDWWLMKLQLEGVEVTCGAHRPFWLFEIRQE
jgi:hypothetical protein